MVNVRKPVLNPHRRTNNGYGITIRSCSMLCRIVLILYISFITLNLLYNSIQQNQQQQPEQRKTIRVNSSSKNKEGGSTGIINHHPIGHKDLEYGKDNDQELPDRNEKDEEDSVDVEEIQPKDSIVDPNEREKLRVDDDKNGEPKEEEEEDEGDEEEGNNEQQDDDEDEKDNEKTEEVEDDKVDADEDKESEIITIKVKEEDNEAFDSSSLVDDPLIKEALQKHGTGPAKLGYVVDLLTERDHAGFRKDTIPTENYYTSIQVEAERLLSDKMKDHKNLISCEYIEGRTLLQRSECWDESSTSRMFVYNPSSFSRVLPCPNNNMQVIGPHEIIQIHETDDKLLCFDQPAKHFQVSKSSHELVNGNIIITDKPTNSGHRHSSTDSQTLDQCDVSCTVPNWTLDKNLKDMKKHELYVAGTDWKIIRSWEDPYYSESSKIEQTAYRQNIFYSTTSFKSAIPLSFFDYDLYNDRLRKGKVSKWKELTNKGSYVQNSECSAYRRNKWFAAVNVAYPVDSYGKCDHNTDLGNGESLDTLDGRLKIQQKYRMALVFESGGEKDHITEPLWESLLYGSVPVILGPSNVNKHFPVASSGNPTAIYASNFVSWDMMAALVKSVAENQTLWESYHDWRTDTKALDQLFDMYNFTRTSPHCRMCLWAYAKLFGLGWDHKQQTIKPETHIPRQLCMTKEHHHKKNRKDVASNDSPLVVHPFIETWIERGSDFTIEKSMKLPTGKHHQQCSKSLSMTDAETIHVLDAERTTIVQRRIFYHDGVTDIYIDKLDTHETDDDIVLRLQFDVRNTEGSYFPHTHTLVPSERGPLMSSISIQDLYSKVTIIANWETKIHSPVEGIVEITVMPNGSSEKKKIDSSKSIQRKRIRIITEDYNPLHDKATEFYPSHFGKLMTMDFIDPLEFLYEQEHR